MNSKILKFMVILNGLLIAYLIMQVYYQPNQTPKTRKSLQSKKRYKHEDFMPVVIYRTGQPVDVSL